MNSSWRVESKRHFARKGEPPTITRCLFVDAPEVTDSGKYRIAKLGEDRFSLSVRERKQLPLWDSGGKGAIRYKLGPKFKLVETLEHEQLVAWLRLYLGQEQAQCALDKFLEKPRTGGKPAWMRQRSAYIKETDYAAS